jgi:hypothetical protein
MSGVSLLYGRWLNSGAGDLPLLIAPMHSPAVRAACDDRAQRTPAAESTGRSAAAPSEQFGPADWGRETLVRLPVCGHYGLIRLLTLCSGDAGPGCGRRLGVRIACPPRGPAWRSIDRELTPMVFEVPGSVVVDVGEAHYVVEVGVPSRREVHPASERRVGLGVEVSVQ